MAEPARLAAHNGVRKLRLGEPDISRAVEDGVETLTAFSRASVSASVWIRRNVQEELAEDEVKARASWQSEAVHDEVHQVR